MITPQYSFPESTTTVPVPVPVVNDPEATGCPWLSVWMLIEPDAVTARVFGVPEVMTVENSSVLPVQSEPLLTRNAVLSQQTLLSDEVTLNSLSTGPPPPNPPLIERLNL